jgi:molybdopterin converting factor small subunit
LAAIKDPARARRKRLAFCRRACFVARMARISFTPNLQRHVPCPPAEVEAGTLREALALVFQDNPMLRDYLLDDQNRLRKHVVIFINAEAMQQRDNLNVKLAPDDDIFIFQALSGG